jgi:DNA (cytosine-5)-methyltransferase 1
MKRDLMSLPLDLGNELIIDNFAGGGGTSTGLEWAFGRPVDIAINHDPQALAMHALNHPYTKHLCESVWDVDPVKATNNQPVGLVWLSPDCKHFSKAKGGTPVSQEIRGLAWIGLRWAALMKPRVIILENVEEFQTWGPLLVDAEGNARPDPKRKGKTFQSFVRQLEQHGYKVESRVMRACIVGTPTIRKRLFLVARRDGLPVRFPEVTHGDPVSTDVLAGMLSAYNTAAGCIDFGLPSESIFDRKKALAVNTLRRVAKGMWRHVLASDKPFIVGAGGPAYSGKPVGVDQPFGTLTTENHRALVEHQLTPFMTEHANSSSQRTMPIDEPMRTLCAQVKGGHFSVVAPIIAPLRGTSEAHLGGRSITEPVSTISAGGTHHALAAAQLLHLTHHGDRAGTTPNSPLPTITGANRGEQALATAFFEQANGGFYRGDGRPADMPLSTITTSGSNQQLVTAFLVKYYTSGGQWQGAGEPMHTLPTKARMGLVQTIKVDASCLSEAQRAKAAKCAVLLHQHLPEHFPELAELVLMWHDGTWWALIDITLRMLKARELFRANSFPESYIIHEIPNPALLFKDGVQVSGDPRLLPRIPLTTTAQIRMCGNCVPPLMAKAIARANFAHEHLIARVA